MKNDDVIKWEHEEAWNKRKTMEQDQGQVPAWNVDHAIALNALFRKEGIASDYVVSSIRDEVTGVTVSREDNERKLQAYRDGEL